MYSTALTAAKYKSKMWNPLSEWQGAQIWKGMKKIVSFINWALNCYPVNEEMYDFDKSDYMCPSGMIPFKMKENAWIVNRVYNNKRILKKRRI